LIHNKLNKQYWKAIKTVRNNVRKISIEKLDVLNFYNFQKLSYSTCKFEERFNDIYMVASGPNLAYKNQIVLFNVRSMRIELKLNFTNYILNQSHSSLLIKNDGVDQLKELTKLTVN
jgi:hypothetical protein